MIVSNYEGQEFMRQMKSYLAVDGVIAILEGYCIDYHWHNIPSKTVTHFLRYRPYIGKKIYSFP